MDKLCPRCKEPIEDNSIILDIYHYVPLVERGYRVKVCFTCHAEYWAGEGYPTADLKEYWAGKLSEDFLKSILAKQEQTLKEAAEKLGKACKEEGKAERAFEKAQEAFIKAKDKKLNAKLTLSKFYGEHTKMQKYISDTEKLITSKKEVEEC